MVGWDGCLGLWKRPIREIIELILWQCIGIWAVKVLSSFYDRVRYVHQVTGRPIWVTEWNNGADWTGGCKPSSQEQNAKKIKAFIKMMDDAPFIERYCIFDWLSGGRINNWSLYNKRYTDDLTPTGIVYQEQVSKMHYNPKKEFVGPYTALPGGFDLKGEALDTLGKNYFKLSWLDRSEDENGVIIERSDNGAPFAQLVLIDKANQTSYMDTIAPGGYVYRIRQVVDAGVKKSAYSNKVSTTVLPEGLSNIVLSKPVKVSSINGENAGERAVDGDTKEDTSRWISIPSKTEPHWLEVDLRGLYEIEMFRLWTGYKGYNKPIADFKFQYFIDDVWKNAFAKSDNTIAYFGVRFDPVKAQKIRLLVTRSNENRVRLYEIEVFGKRLGKANQKITFKDIPELFYGSKEVNLEAYTSSGLPVDVSLISGDATLHEGAMLSIGKPGEVIIEATQTGDEAYNSAEPLRMALTVKKARLQVIAESKKITYGDRLPELTFNYKGFVKGETEEALVSKPEIQVETDGNKAGNYDISLSGGEAVNYSLEYVSGNLQIDKIDLKVTVEDVIITYGDSIPAFTLSYNGFIDGENESVLASVPRAEVVTDSSVTAGLHDVVVSGGQADNYSFQYHNGMLEVKKADQIITIEKIEDKSLLASPFDIVASVDTKLPLTYEISGPASISGKTITLDGNDGVVKVKVIQKGDTNHNMAIAEEVFSVGALIANTESSKLSDLLIYPNPVRNLLYIKKGKTVVQNARMLSVDGRVLMSLPRIENSIDLSGLINGVYLLEVNTNQFVQRFRVIKAE